MLPVQPYYAAALLFARRASWITKAQTERTPIGYHNAVLIYNPKAGRFGREGQSLVSKTIAVLRQAGIDAVPVPTTGPRTGGFLAREHVDKGAGLIIVAGGDGTINEVAEGMVHTETPLAVLPAGTANVLATELKLGRKLERAARRIPDLRPIRIALGHVTCEEGRVSRHFMLMAGVGLDAHIVYNVDAVLKSKVGKLAYWLAGWSIMGKRLPQLEAVVEGRRHVCSFALISKVRNYGGDFEIAQDVRLSDRRFEVVLFQGPDTTAYLRYFLAMALKRLRYTRGVTTLRTNRVILERPADDRVFIQIDGEFAGHLPAEIHIVADALTLLVPDGYLNSRFIGM
jgi:YegS/Rv2252/BmrU family lipid kinase